MSLLLSLGLVVQAWDVPSTTNQSDPQIQRRWADNREPTFSTEEARAGKLGSGGVHLHRRVEDSPSADFQRKNDSRITDPDDGNGDGGDDRLESTIEPMYSGFLELAQQRFVEREGRMATVVEDQWTFDHLQLVRIPKAASTEASVVARRLAGCNPRGPCCKYPGSPRGSCPAHDLYCPQVTGCIAHNMRDVEKEDLLSPDVFSMANVRDVTDRIISGFFYSAPHSPRCARAKHVDYDSCFQEMIDRPEFQNVASKMLCGYNAYDGSMRVCSKREDFSATFPAFPHVRCMEDMASVIRGACHLNFVTICEAWGSSLLLLFETLPWLGPTGEFFPQVVVESSSEEGGGEHRRTLEDEGEEEEEEPQHERENLRKKEEINHITPHMMEMAQHTNGADMELYEFVTAKFCDRLRDIGLLETAVVQNELSRRDQLEERCNNASWIEDTLERFEPLTPKDCRLFEPLARPKDR
ncbi:unnamed protein product [Ascophyllum nodosum]